MNLTEEQQEAVQSKFETTVVEACPGAGKTTVLIERINHLIANGVNPDSIVAITYTLAAAAEIQGRLAVKVGFCGTLHALCLKLLRTHADHIGFSVPLTVLSKDVAAVAFSELAARLSYKGTKSDLKEAVREMVTAGQPEFHPQRARLVAATWFAEMLTNGALDFDGILFWTIRALRTFSWNIGKVHLLVDEAQDMAEVDWMIYSMLPCESRFIVGDPDQSIFGFRGGKPEYMKRFESATFLQLTASNRCSPAVADLAGALIAPGFKPADVEGSGEFAPVGTFKEEIMLIGDRILKIPTGQTAAVLVRTNFHVDEYSEGLKYWGINVAREVKPQMPEEWPAAKMALAAIASPSNDWLMSQLVSLLNHEATPEIIRRSAAARRANVIDLYDDIPRNPIAGQAVQWLSQWQFISKRTIDALWTMVEKMGWTTALSDLLVEIEQMELEAVQRTDGVVVATIHAAKGREWDWVFLPAMEDEVHPGNKGGSVEEARWLVYVAITRARRHIVISHAKQRVLNGFQNEPVATTPSRFLKEMGLGQ